MELSIISQANDSLMMFVPFTLVLANIGLSFRGTGSKQEKQDNRLFISRPGLIEFDYIAIGPENK